MADDIEWQFISNVENGKQILKKVMLSTSKPRAKERPRIYSTQKSRLKNQTRVDFLMKDACLGISDASIARITAKVSKKK